MGKGKQQKNKSKSNNKVSAKNGLIILVVFFLVSLGIDIQNRDPYLGLRLLGFSLVGIFAVYLFYRLKIDFEISSKLNRWILFGVGGFLIWNAISLLYAPSSSEVLFQLSRYGLYGGLLFLFFFLFKTKTNLFDRLAPFVAVYSILISLVGLLQGLEIGFLFIPGYPQPVGISGNRNIFGSQVALLLPFSLYVFLMKENVWKWIGLLSLTFGIVVLLFSQTRSAWLGAGIAFIFTNLLIYYKKESVPSSIRKNLNLINGVSFGVLLLGISYIFILAPQQDLSKAIKSRLVSLVQPFNDNGDIASQNVSERIYVWRKTLSMTKDHPLLGVGSGNWRIIFPLYGKGAKVDLNLADLPIRVRPHNFFLRVLSENGLIGLLLLLGIIGLIFRAGRQAFQNSNSTSQILPLVIAIAGLNILLIDMLFSFSLERTETSLIALIFLALILSKSDQLTKDKSILKLNTTLTAGLLVGLFLYTALFGYYRWKFDKHIYKVAAYDYQNAPYKMLEEVTKGKNSFIKIGPVSDPLEFQAGRAYLKLNEFDQAVAATITAEKIHPNNHRIFNTRAAAQLRMGKFEEALVSVNRALELTPQYEPAIVNSVLIHYELGNNQLLDTALSKLNTAIYPVLRKLPAKLLVRQEREAFAAQELYQAIYYVQGQLEDNTKEVNIAPLVDLYKTYPSDSAFIADYIDVLGQEVIFKAIDEGVSDEDQTRMHSTIGKAKYLLLYNHMNPFTVKVILENNHRITKERLFTKKPEDFKTVKDVIAWVNE